MKYLPSSVIGRRWHELDDINNNRTKAYEINGVKTSSYKWRKGKSYMNMILKWF